MVSDRASDAVKSSWEQIFEDTGVNLVLCGYQIKISTDKKFSKNTYTYRTDKDYKIFKNLKKNKTYYIRKEVSKPKTKKLFTVAGQRLKK